MLQFTMSLEIFLFSVKCFRGLAITRDASTSLLKAMVIFITEAFVMY